MASIDELRTAVASRAGTKVAIEFVSSHVPRIMATNAKAETEVLEYTKENVQKALDHIRGISSPDVKSV